MPLTDPDAQQWRPSVMIASDADLLPADDGSACNDNTYLIWTASGLIYADGSYYAGTEP